MLKGCKERRKRNCFLTSKRTRRRRRLLRLMNLHISLDSICCASFCIE